MIILQVWWNVYSIKVHIFVIHSCQIVFMEYLSYFQWEETLKLPDAIIITYCGNDYCMYVMYVLKYADYHDYNNMFILIYSSGHIAV